MDSEHSDTAGMSYRSYTNTYTQANLKIELGCNIKITRI